MKTSAFSLFAGLIAVAPSLVTSVPLFNQTISIWSERAAGPAPVQELAIDTELERRATAQAPHWVIYWDQWINGENGPPAVSLLKGYNTLILSVLLSSGPADQISVWKSLPARTRASIKSSYAAAGIKIMVTAFGSTDAPTSSGKDAVSTANWMANFVKTWGLDGIDVDYEDFAAIDSHNGRAENWLITFTKTLRNALPAGSYLITHAPVAPWFSPIYTAGAYRKVHSSVGSLIDWYNIQFYNQGTKDYTSCNGLLRSSPNQFPDSTVFQIHSSAGVPLDKIVIGKPGKAWDADSGYTSPSVLASCVAQAKSLGWNGGVMFWEYPDASSAEIITVRASSWPV